MVLQLTCVTHYLFKGAERKEGQVGRTRQEDSLSLKVGAKQMDI